MKHTLLENIISVGIGLALGIPVALTTVGGRKPEIVLEVQACEYVPPVPESLENHDSDAEPTIFNAIEPDPEVVEEVPAYTDEQLFILAHIICGEAQGCSDDHQLAVGSVFLNRVDSAYYPNTFEGVAFQKGQYACTWDGNYNRQPTDRNIANAIYLLENGSVLPSNVVFQASFKQGSGVHQKIGNTYFCYK